MTVLIPVRGKSAANLHIKEDLVAVLDRGSRIW